MLYMLSNEALSLLAMEEENNLGNQLKIFFIAQQTEYFFILMVRRVFEESRNIFKTAVSVVVVDLLGVSKLTEYLFCRKLNTYLCDSNAMAIHGSHKLGQHQREIMI